MRWIVDGMNVIGTRPDGWWKDRHAAMVRLVDELERWVAREGDDVTVVFEHPPRPPIRSPSSRSPTRAARAPTPPTTRSFAACGPTRRRPTSALSRSDHALADQARFLGAVVQSAESFRRDLEDG